jgi:hypothetical protein
MPLSAVPLGFLILMLFDTAGGVISLLLPIAWAAVPLMVALWGSPRVRQSPLRILALLTPSAAMFALCFPIFSGGDDWGLGSLAWAVIPLMIALGTAPILAIASLWRRERFPGLAAVVLVGYGGWLTVYGLEQVHEAFGGVGLLMVFTAAVGVPAAWLMWRFRKRFAALGVGTKQV